MKKIFNYRILAFLFIATILYVACTKETANTRLPAKISTSQLKNVTADSATVVGFVVAAGAGFTEEGVVYGKSAAPTTSSSKFIFTGPTSGATYTAKIGGLASSTIYYARAYAITPTETLYGEQVTFTTLTALTTAAFTGITGNAATGGGNVIVGGGVAVTARGICYGTNHNPDISGSKTSDGTGTGPFVSVLSALKGNTTYYVRAYGTSSVGTGYGPEVSFKTPVDLPVVSTDSLKNVTKVSAILYNRVSYDGGGTVTARGLAWGTSESPTIAGTVLSGGTGTGSFISNLTGLTSGTVYHVRAYATNSAGTAYGADKMFTTIANILTWGIPGDYVSASYPGSAFNNWDPANSPIVMSTISAGDKLEGYVYMANASNNWKFTANKDWSVGYANNDGNGVLEPGVLDPAAKNNITSPAGYYKINANATTMTYTQVATTWGIMGDYNNWASQTNMIYNPASQTFSLALHLTSGGTFKFRGTSDWSVNFGNTAGDGTTLDYGAANNIPVTTTADYALTLDLSHPNAYTYSANFWGLIGDATPGSWSTDTPMTWDPIHNVFTATLALSTANGASFKIRANGAWTLAYGGTLSALTTAGGAPNLSVPTAGNYTITFDPWKVIATATKN